MLLVESLILILIGLSAGVFGISTIHEESRHFGSHSNTVESQHSECPVSFQKIGGRCYFYGYFKLNWFRAAEFCHSFGLGASLATIESLEENDHIERFLLQHGDQNTGVWLGGSENGHVGTWAWFPTGTLVEWTNWGIGQPTGQDQHCMYIVGGQLGYQWADFHCGFQMTFLCEYENNVYTPWQLQHQPNQALSTSAGLIGPPATNHSADLPSTTDAPLALPTLETFIPTLTSLASLDAANPSLASLFQLQTSGEEEASSNSGASQPAATPPTEALLSTFVTFDASSDEASAGASSLEAASAEEAFSEAISASLSDAVDGFFISGVPIKSAVDYSLWSQLVKDPLGIQSSFSSEDAAGKDADSKTDKDKLQVYLDNEKENMIKVLAQDTTSVVIDKSDGIMDTPTSQSESEDDNSSRHGSILKFLKNIIKLPTMIN